MASSIFSFYPQLLLLAMISISVIFFTVLSQYSRGLFSCYILIYWYYNWGINHCAICTSLHWIVTLDILTELAVAIIFLIVCYISRVDTRHNNFVWWWFWLSPNDSRDVYNKYMVYYYLLYLLVVWYINRVDITNSLARIHFMVRTVGDDFLSFGDCLQMYIFLLLTVSDNKGALASLLSSFSLPDYVRTLLISLLVGILLSACDSNYHFALSTSSL